MNSFPWLTVTAALPAIGALVLIAVPKAQAALVKVVALAFSLATLLLTGAIAAQFAADGGVQFSEQYEWIPSFGIHYALGLDGIGLSLFALTALLAPVVILASWNDVDDSGDDRAGADGVEHAERGRRSARSYFALMLVLETLSLGVFAATDVFLFYLLFEATLIPVYFLVGGFGTGGQRSYAAVKFLVYSLVGGLIMLGSIIGLYAISGSQGDPTFLLSELTDLQIDSGAQKWLFVGFFIAFAVKAPMWPVHTWLPDTTAAARPGTSVLLVSVLDKIGTFGMIRFCLQLFPEASQWATPVVLALAVISVMYGAVLAIGQRNIMRLIAYTSVSHFGVMVLAIFAMTSQGQTGATVYMISHGLSTAALFLVAGYFIRRRGSAQIGDFGGVDKVAPVLSGTFLFACLAGLALPGLSTFVGEFLALAGTFSRYPIHAVIATCSIILAALYMLILFQKTMTGPTAPAVEKMADLKVREIVAVAPLVALIIGLGLFPKPAIDAISPTIEETLTQVNVEDPQPDVPVEASEEGK